MKWVLAMLGAAALAALLTFLAVTRQGALRETERLRSALQEAEDRLAEAAWEVDRRRQRLMLHNQTADLPLTTRNAVVTPVESDPQEPAAPAPAVSLLHGSVSPMLHPIPVGATVAYKTYGSGGIATNLLRIEGASSAGDWRAQTRLIGGTMFFEEGFPENFAGVPGQKSEASVQAVTPVNSLVSVKPDGTSFSLLLDGVLRRTLKSDRFPAIAFTLDTLTERDKTNALREIYPYQAEGLLTIAGVANRITVPVEVTRRPDSLLRFTGSFPLLMSDYTLTAPREIQGAPIKANDEVVVSFVWHAKRNDSPR